MRKIVISLGICSLLSGCVSEVTSNSNIAMGATASSVQFTDISDHWAKDSVIQAVAKGYVDGYEDGTFRPDQQVTRAEFIKMAATGLKLAVSGAGEAWYSGYVKAAVEAGFHKYEDFDSGDMNTPISREEMARIAVRAVDSEQQKETNDKKLVYETVKRGLIQGLSGGELGLDEATTRAQSVTVIERILTVNGGGTLEVDKAALGYAEVELTGSNIQTMWGIQAKELPMTLDVPISANITMDKLLVIDLTNDNDPYRWMFPYLRKENKQPIGEEYLVAMHLKVTNQEVKSDVKTISFILSPIGFTFAFVPADKRGQEPINDLTKVNLLGVESANGWYMMTRSKESVDQALKKNVLSLNFHIVNAGGTFDITK